MSATSPPTPDGEPWTADYASSNGATANVQSDSIRRLVVLGYITAFAMPLIGFILGIVVVMNPAKASSKHGPRIIAISIVASIVWILILSSGALTATSTDIT